MDTDELSNMAYQSIITAFDIHDVLKSELGAESRNHKTEDEYLHSILSHVKSIKADSTDYLESWGIFGEVDLDDFNIKIETLLEHIKATINTPIKERGKPYGSLV